MRKEDLYGTYIKVENKEEFEAIQEYLFGLGLGWDPSGKKQIPYNKDLPYILIYKGDMGRGKHSTFAVGNSVKDLIPDPLDNLEMYDILSVDGEECIFMEYSTDRKSIKVELITGNGLELTEGRYPKEYIPAGNGAMLFLNKSSFKFVRRGIKPIKADPVPCKFKIGDFISSCTKHGVILGFTRSKQSCVIQLWDSDSHDGENLEYWFDDNGEAIPYKGGRDRYYCTIKDNAYKKLQLRFKTEKEFAEQYGDKWRNTVPSSFTIYMDGLLGKPFEGAMVDGFPTQETITGKYWRVSKEMLTWEPLPEVNSDPEEEDLLYYIGKKIKILNTRSADELKVGQVYTIESIRPDSSNDYKVNFEDCIDGWYCNLEDFEVIPEEEPTKLQMYDLLRDKEGRLYSFIQYVSNTNLCEAECLCSDPGFCSYMTKTAEQIGYKTVWEGNSTLFTPGEYTIEELRGGIPYGTVKEEITSMKPTPGCKYKPGDIVWHISMGRNVRVESVDDVRAKAYTLNELDRDDPWISCESNVEDAHKISGPLPALTRPTTTWGQEARAKLGEYAAGLDPYHAKSDRDIAMGMAIYTRLLFPGDDSSTIEVKDELFSTIKPVKIPELIHFED